MYKGVFKMNIIWSEVRGRDLTDLEVSMELAEDKNAWKLLKQTYLGVYLRQGKFPESGFDN